jgi:hypothetical protein
MRMRSVLTLGSEVGGCEGVFSEEAVSSGVEQATSMPIIAQDNRVHWIGVLRENEFDFVKIEKSCKIFSRMFRAEKFMRILCLFLFSVVLIAACQSAPTPTPVPAPTIAAFPTIISPTGYRPLQEGDIVEGAPISYQYVLPSLDQPVVTVALSTNLLELIQVKPELTNNLLDYIRELVQSPVPVFGYDEANPNQTEPAAITFDPTKPVEIAFIQLVEGTHYWSVTETDDQGIQAAYKIVRRKDGGLRFIDAYGLISLHSSASMFTLNGGGTGLVFSARLALLKLILKDARYQKGTNVFATFPVDSSAYDKRILDIDPSRQGLAQDRDWVLVSHPGPNPGLVGP